MSSADQLSSIHTFKDLVRYLEEQLDWPLEEYGFDDLTFVYEPAELGLKEEDAAKVRTIHQLRPLEHGQPLGIFFIEFEKKKLPVVVLRRILSHLVIKKRASANKSDAKRWQASDLIFISAFGDEAAGQREIAFAHFHQPEGDLPTLRVLGWDGADTPLKLEHVAATLKEKLHWPADTADHDAWRCQWSAPFRHRIGHTIRTADALAEELASLAKRIRSAAERLMKAESDRGPLTKLFKAFQAALIHDLTEESFADTYAQTITYGLFTAAVNRTEMSAGTAGTFVKADDIAIMARVTSPFLKEMLETFLHVGGRKNGVDFDELGIQDVVELLRGDETDLPAILRDFGNRTRGEDPVIHFYEHFLSAYNKKLKIQRGVFYTPQPVVSYIVRSVHELLQTEFGLEDGLASTVTWSEMLKKHPGLKLPPKSDEPGEKATIAPDEPFVQILDPATGTATFLVETVDVIHKHLQAKWKTGGAAAMPKIPNSQLLAPNFLSFWNEYVPRALLPRLHGYELLAAPYAIAHLKLGLKLTETGYRFGSAERARIYLTNALEPKVKQLPQIGFEPLAHEAQAVNEIKWYKRFTVVIGNPPYAGHSQNNQIQSIVNLVKDFTRDEPSLQGPGQGKWLQDDYVKFLRLSQAILGETKVGTLGMITNHRYLTNRTFKGMRRQWCSIFPSTKLLDLHGNRVVDEVSPLGHDENVFDIEQGVSIGFFTRAFSTEHSVMYSELWGNCLSTDGKGKYDFLASNSAKSTKWGELKPTSPNWLFAPREEVDDDTRAEFESGLKLLELMPGVLGPNGKPQSGLATMHDNFALSFSVEELEEKIRTFVRTRNREEAKELFGTLCNPGQWDYAEAKKTLTGQSWRKKISRIWFSPFDQRQTVYDSSVAVHLRKRLSQHLFDRKNLALVVGEAGQEISGNDWDAVSCVDSILQLNFFRRNGSPTLPLYVFDEDDLLAIKGSSTRRPNFSPSKLKIIADKLGLKIGKNNLPDGVTPEDIFHYAYAVFHSPGYRSRYAEFLKIDFPRLPLTGNLELFRALARLGGELTALHLLESPKLAQPITEYLGGRAPEVEKVSWSKNTVWLDKAQTIGFKGVCEDVWNFHIGGYQVCEKWLKDRKSRPLSADDRTHYQKIIVALSETIRLMREIDAVIAKHGGWPLK
jgi:hypothetical protein